jgi:L-serine dehydratase
MAVMERISVFDIFKIGVGPSSSHTMGPWKAAINLLNDVNHHYGIEQVREITVHLYGSLAKTGKGHGTDLAVLMGLSGEHPETIEAGKIHSLSETIRKQERIMLAGRIPIGFSTKKNFRIHPDKFLDFHPNGMEFEVILSTGEKFSETYYSIGGGFIVKDKDQGRNFVPYPFPYPIDEAADIEKWCNQLGIRVNELVWRNETSIRNQEEIQSGLNLIWKTMLSCIYRGCHTDGVLPGGLNVHRRAHTLARKLSGSASYGDEQEWMQVISGSGNSFSRILNWVSCFALAVNEENAAFGRVVTAPTNGAAGVIPAVLLYHLCFNGNNTEKEIHKFLLTAGEIGSVFKKGATISAAMGGCQAEIGVSSAMAAAALTDCLGGDPLRVLMAAEIAMEHHLGMTCDPVGGLVQIPCIERNTMGAVKAITASQIALESDPGKAKVSLDSVIRTMWDTAQDMNTKYKETAEGGLARHIPVNLADC